MGPAPRVAGQRYHQPQARPGLSELARMTSRSPGWRLPPPRRPRLAGPPARRPPPPPSFVVDYLDAMYDVELLRLAQHHGRHASPGRTCATLSQFRFRRPSRRRYWQRPSLQRGGKGGPRACALPRPRRESPWAASAAVPLAERVADVGVSPFSQAKWGVTAVKLPTEGFHREQARRSKCPRSAPRPEKRLLQEADAPGRPKGQCPALCLPCAKVKAPEGGCRNTPVLGKGSRSDEEKK